MRTLTRAVILLGAILVAVSAGLYQTTVDKQTIPGAATSVTVTDWDRTMSWQQVSATLDEISASTGSNIYKQGYAPDGASREYFAYIGNAADSDAFPPGGTFDSFDPASSVRFLAASENVNGDPRGSYLIQGDGDIARSVEQSLVDEGFVFSTATTYSVASSVSDALVRTHVVTALIVLILCVGVVVVYDCLVDARAHAVREMFGHSDREITTRKLVLVAGNTLAICSAVAAMSGVALAIYNRWNNFRSFLAVLAGSTALYAVFILVAAWIGIRLSRGLSIVAFLKGANVDRSAYRLALVSKLLLFAIVAAFAASALSSFSQVARSGSLWSGWDRQPPLLAASFSPAIVDMSADETVAVQASVRQIAATAAVANPSSLVVSGASGTPTEILDTAPTVDFTPDGSGLVVNNRYLELNEVRDETGDLIRDVDTADSNATVTLLVPHSRQPQTEEIVDQYRRWLEFQRSLSASPGNGDAPRIVVEYTADGQMQFNYLYDGQLASSYSADPVIMVNDPRSSLLSDDYWMAAATRGQVLFGNDLSETFDAAGLSAVVPYLYAVKERASDSFYQQRRDDVVHLAATLFAIGIAALASATVGALYVDANRKALYIRRLFGAAAPARHASIAALVLSVQVASITVVATSGLAPDLPAFLGVLALILAADLAVLGLAVARNERITTPTVLQQH